MKNVCLASCLVFLTTAIALADETAKPPADKTKFELRDGDRVVFLGNTLIERAQKYGYWETMLTARYPDRDITFRNLGWSGDTVWAESRGIFDPPAVGYQRMIEHVGRLKPTVIFIGYGNNEAFAGKEGLPVFIKQYNKLLDDLTGVSAEDVRFVVLSPTWITPDVRFGANRESENEKRALYRDALMRLSHSRKIRFVDLHHEMEIQYKENSKSPGLPSPKPLEPLTTRDWQPSDSGYFAIDTILDLALYIDNEFDQPNLHDDVKIDIDAVGKVQSQVHAEVTQVKITESSVTMNVTCKELPSVFIEFKIEGLEPGKYIVKSGQHVFGPTNNVELSKGALIQFITKNDELGPTVAQYEKLRQAIIDKNRLYFYRWRPQNITYLFGFRKHEQGQNAKELAEFDKLIAAKEAEINKLKKPVPHTYEIIRVKDKPAEKQNDKQSQKQ